MNLRTLRRSLLLVTCFAAASLPVSVPAIEVEESSQKLQSLLAEVRELIPVIRGQAHDLKYTIVRAEQSTGDVSRALDSSYEFRELKRSTSRMTEIGNSIYTLASRCG